MTLFASETTDVVVQNQGVFPEYFGTMLLALVIVAAVATVLAVLGWRVIDWITPGNLNTQLLGDPGNTDPMQGAPRPRRDPNLPLAVVVASMFLGFSLILGCTIIGVMVH